MTRNEFISSLAGLSLLPVFARSQPTISQDVPTLIDLHKKIDVPLKIESIELIRAEGELFVRVRGSNGLNGMTMANTRMPNLVSIFNNMVAPFFKGQDARDVAKLVRDIYTDDRNYKYSGMPFSNCVGHAEIAILDLVGKTLNVPAQRLFGKTLRTEVPVYLSSLTRETSPEEECEFLKRKLEETGARAIKFKVGGRNKYDEASRQRTVKLVPMLRKTLGDGITLYADGNSSFTVSTGIEVGKLLQDHGVSIFEEPCPWEDVESNQQVAKALKMIVAGGEQDSSLHRWQFLARNTVYDLLQPDIYYNGGVIRLMEVASIAANYKKEVAPHSPKADPLASPFLQAAAVLPNLHGFQEYPAAANPNKFPSWYHPHFIVKNGNLEIPKGSGMGVEFDDSLLEKGQVLGG